jgi:hypothetical protein
MRLQAFSERVLFMVIAFNGIAMTIGLLLKRESQTEAGGEAIWPIKMIDDKLSGH